VTSSVYHSQSNGKAVNIVKKAQKSGKDPWKSIRGWRNTPSEGMDSSPVQRLMSRRTRHSLPIAKALVRPKVIECVHVAEKIKHKH